MILLEKNLDKLPFKIKDFEILRRGMQHDLDKFSDSAAPRYLRIEEYKYNEKWYSKHWNRQRGAL